MAANIQPSQQSGAGRTGVAGNGRSGEAWQYARSRAGGDSVPAAGELKSRGGQNAQQGASRSAPATPSGGLWDDNPSRIHGDKKLAPQVPAKVLPQSREVASQLVDGKTIQQVKADNPKVSDKAINGALELLGVSDRQIAYIANGANMNRYGDAVYAPFVQESENRDTMLKAPACSLCDHHDGADQGRAIRFRRQPHDTARQCWQF